MRVLEKHLASAFLGFVMGAFLVGGILSEVRMKHAQEMQDIRIRVAHISKRMVRLEGRYLEMRDNLRRERCRLRGQRCK